MLPAPDTPHPDAMLPAFPACDPLLATPAVWIPETRREGWVVGCFRAVVHLAEPLPAASLRVSASQRFTCWVDGVLVGRGPSRSDEDRWGVARLGLGDLAAGRHVLAIRVHHFGDRAGVAQMGPPAFLLVYPEHSALAGWSTAAPWRCRQDRSRRPIDRHAWVHQGYYVVGAGERVIGSSHPWGWTGERETGDGWRDARVVAKAAEDTWGHLRLGARLRPDPLPPMAETVARCQRLARAPDDLLAAGSDWLSGRGRLRIAAGRRVRLVVDRGHLVNAYPELTVSGGAGSRIRTVSAEASYDGPSQAKGDRNAVAGKFFYGHRDEYRPDGGSRRGFSPCWFRSFRYWVLEISVADDDVILDDLVVRETGFPLAPALGFRADADHAAAVEQVAEVCDRTIRACSHELFFDCPHHEQCQFPGDTRIQALYHYLVHGEDRLARKAIDDFHASRRSDGMLVCRWPSRSIQVLPTFALHWILILDDFLAWRGDPAFVADYLPAAREILAWFRHRRRADGLPGRIGLAPFVDWAEGFACGNAPQDEDGGSALIALFELLALQAVARIERSTGAEAAADATTAEAAAQAAVIRRLCWDSARGFLRDTATGPGFSQHAQFLAVIAGLVPAEECGDLLRRALAADDLVQPGSFYFRFYQLEAARVAGLGDMVWDELPRWLRCLEGTGLTTWPETERDQPRSDCHAWSVAPAILWRNACLGLVPVAPGAARMRFAPRPGPCRRLAGTLALPSGRLTVALERHDSQWRIDLETPVPIEVTALGRDLAPGHHRFALPG